MSFAEKMQVDTLNYNPGVFSWQRGVAIGVVGAGSLIAIAAGLLAFTNIDIPCIPSDARFWVGVGLTASGSVVALVDVAALAALGIIHTRTKNQMQDELENKLQTIRDICVRNLFNAIKGYNACEIETQYKFYVVAHCDGKYKEVDVFRTAAQRQKFTDKLESRGIRSVSELNY